jgi:hypothetical protein
MRSRQLHKVLVAAVRWQLGMQVGGALLSLLAVLGSSA